MTAEAPLALRRHPAKPTRAERNQAVRERLFEAGIKVVGEHGYSEASVSRITAAAGVSQGTFYTHYENRQELLDELLPRLGKRMVEFIRERTNGGDDEATKEIGRFRAFFDFLHEVPEFQRILNEAEFFAPKGYERHLDNIAGSYARLLRRGRKPGGVSDFTDEELDAVVHMLMGARGYLSRRYAYENGGVTRVPEFLVSAYGKLVRGGLFQAGDEG